MADKFFYTKKARENAMSTLIDKGFSSEQAKQIINELDDKAKRDFEKLCSSKIRPSCFQLRFQRKAA